MKTEAIEFQLYNGKVKGKFFPDSHIYMIDGKRKTGVTTYISIIDKSRPLIIWATELYRDYLLGIYDKLDKDAITREHILEGAVLHEKKKAEAGSIGDEVHGWIEAYVQGKAADMPSTKEAQIGVNAFLDWEAENKVKFLSSERVVYSKKYDYIGKMDIEAKVNGKLCLIDIKTSNGLYNTNGMQTAAYVMADQEEASWIKKPVKYAGRWLIRLAKETETEYKVRMAKKNQNRAFKGRESVEYPPYQVFEAKYLDETAGNIERDFEGFLAAKKLYEWNKATDFFTNGK